MRMNLDRANVAVFGAGRGIGRAIAEAFVEEGCFVFGFDSCVPESPPNASPIQFTAGDVTDREQLAQFGERCPPLDHVVYCVGIGSGQFGFPFWKVDPGHWSRVLEVNLIGAVQVAHQFAPAMAERRRGTLLFLSSVAGQIGSPTDPPYSASKAGLINFMQCAAKDLAAFGVRANAISPGMVKTDLNRSVWLSSQAGIAASQRVDYETWAEQKLRKVAPLGRWQEPGEFAAMAVYLASDHARNITGQTINVDGGWVMHS